MRMYVVKVASYMPYKIERIYTKKATSMRTAVGRSITDYRKDPRITRHKLDNLIVSVGIAKL